MTQVRRTYKTITPEHAKKAVEAAAKMSINDLIERGSKYKYVYYMYCYCFILTEICMISQTEAGQLCKIDRATLSCRNKMTSRFVTMNDRRFIHYWNLVMKKLLPSEQHFTQARIDEYSKLLMNRFEFTRKNKMFRGLP